LLDVAVIGGGPVGSRAAYKLAGLGYKVVVLEKKDEIGGKSCCTGIISRECADAFGIPSDLYFKKVNSAQLFSPGAKTIHIFRPEVQACIVDRSAFDRYQAETAQSRGAEYRLKSRVEHISFEPDKAEIESEEGGNVRKITAKSVVLATGFNAPLARDLGLGGTSYFAAGAQADVGIEGINEVEVYFDQKLAPGFFAWIVPTLPGRCLIGLLARRSPGFNLKNWIARLEVEGRIIPAKHQIRFGGIPLKPLSRTFDDRLVVVGDAAGQVKPTTGGGIYFGLLCADIAADTLDKALQSGDLSSKKLSQYERGWRKKLGAELRTELLARRLYEHLADSHIDWLFLRLKSSGVFDSLLDGEPLSFDWHGNLVLKVLKLYAMNEANRLLRIRRNDKQRILTENPPQSPFF
jgi:digeranylgeranylglycerophospholipid reductase